MYKNYAAFSHVTHGVLQERNLEGQTLLAIIEVNRYTLYIQVKENIWNMKPKIVSSRVQCSSNIKDTYCPQDLPTDA